MEKVKWLGDSADWAWQVAWWEPNDTVFRPFSMEQVRYEVHLRC